MQQVPFVVVFALFLLTHNALAYDCFDASSKVSEVSATSFEFGSDVVVTLTKGDTQIALLNSPGSAPTIMAKSTIISGSCSLYARYMYTPTLTDHEISANGTTSLFASDVKSDGDTWFFAVTTGTSCTLSLNVVKESCQSMTANLGGSVEIDMAAVATNHLCLKFSTGTTSHASTVSVSSVTGSCVMYGECDYLAGSSSESFEFSGDKSFSFVSTGEEIKGGVSWYFLLRASTLGSTCKFTLAPSEHETLLVEDVATTESSVYFQGWKVAPTASSSSPDRAVYYTGDAPCVVNIAFGGNGCSYSVAPEKITPVLGSAEHVVYGAAYPDSMSYLSFSNVNSCSSKTSWVIVVKNLTACTDPVFVVQQYNDTMQSIDVNNAADTTVAGLSRRGEELIPFELTGSNDYFYSGHVKWTSWTEGCSAYLTYPYFMGNASATTTFVDSDSSSLPTLLIGEGASTGGKKWKGVMTVPAGKLCELKIADIEEGYLGTLTNGGTYTNLAVAENVTSHFLVGPPDAGNAGSIGVMFSADTPNTCLLYASPGVMSVSSVTAISPSSSEVSYVASNLTSSTTWFLTIKAQEGPCTGANVTVRLLGKESSTSLAGTLTVSSDSAVHKVVEISPLDSEWGTAFLAQTSATCVSSAMVNQIGVATGQTSTYISVGSDAQALKGESFLYAVLDSTTTAVYIAVDPGSGDCVFEWNFLAAVDYVDGLVLDFHEAGRYYMTKYTSANVAVQGLLTGRVGSDCSAHFSDSSQSFLQGLEISGSTTAGAVVPALKSGESSGAASLSWYMVIDLCPTGVCGNCSLGSYSGSGTAAGGFCTKCAAGSYQESTGDIAACSSCPVGYRQPSAGQSSCTVCARGTYMDVEGSSAQSCKSCTTGSYQNSTGQSGCISCPVGYYTDALKQTECKQCEAGMYQATVGGTQCQECSAGSYSSTDRTQCLTCDKGTYAEQKASACTTCPYGTTTQENGASSSTYCACDTSNYGDKDNQLSCKACPANTECGWNTKFPVANAGFWISASDGDTSYSCTPSAACPGGIETCNEGYTGEACSECEDNYYRANGVCHQCSTGAIDNSIIVSMFVIGGLGLPCVLCLFFVCAGFFYDMVSIRSAASAAAGFKTNIKLSTIFVPITRTMLPAGKIVKFMQLSTISLGLGIDWPASISWMYNLVSISTLNFDIVLQPECRSDSLFSYQAKYYIRFAVPILIILSCLMVIGFGRCISISASMLQPAVYTIRRNHTRWNNLGKNIVTVGIRALLVFLILIYVFAHSVTLEIFSCAERGAGEYFLLQDAQVQCYKGGGQWIQMFPVSVLGLIVYSFGIPAIFVMVVLSYRKTRGPTGHYGVARYGFIFGAYEEQFFYWELVVFANKFFLTLVLPMITVGTRDQLNYLTFMSLVFLLILVRTMPYANPKEDIMEFNVAFAVLFTTLSGLVFQSGNGSSVTSVFFEVVLVIVHTYVWLYFFYFLADVLNLSKVFRKLCPTKGTVAKDPNQVSGPIESAVQEDKYDDALQELKNYSKEISYLAMTDGLVPKMVKNLSCTPPPSKRTSEVPFFDQGQPTMPPSPTIVERISDEDSKRLFNTNVLLEVFKNLERDSSFLVAVGEKLREKYSALGMDSGSGEIDIPDEGIFHVGTDNASGTARSGLGTMQVSRLGDDVIGNFPAAPPRKTMTTSGTPLLDTDGGVSTSDFSPQVDAGSIQQIHDEALDESSQPSAPPHPEDSGSQDQEDNDVRHLLGSGTKVLSRKGSGMDVKSALAAGMRNISSASMDIIESVLDSPRSTPRNTPRGGIRRGSHGSGTSSGTNVMEGLPLPLPHSSHRRAESAKEGHFPPQPADSTSAGQNKGNHRLSQ